MGFFSKVKKLWAGGEAESNADAPSAQPIEHGAANAPQDDLTASATDLEPVPRRTGRPRRGVHGTF